MQKLKHTLESATLNGTRNIGLNENACLNWYHSNLNYHHIYFLNPYPLIVFFHGLCSSK